MNIGCWTDITQKINIKTLMQFVNISLLKLYL